VRFPKGIKDGQTLRLREKGKPGVNGGPPGDARVKIMVQPHKRLKRKENDLYLTVPISLSEAMKGVKVELDLPTGKVSLSMPSGTNSGKRFRLKDKGVRAKDGTGDLYVTAQIVLTDGELAAISAHAQTSYWGESGVVVLEAQRSITPAEAKSIARKKVPGGKVVDIKRRGDTYSVRVIKKSGQVVDVLIDANTGRVK